jgi:hypothetical protein
MRKLALLILGLVAAGVVIAATASAATRGARTCSTPDNKGNWEVVIGHAATTKAAGTIRARAVAKGLHATTERDGCAKRWEVVVTAATKAKATKDMTTARKDGFKSSTLEKS